jgi:hypothetical protein
MPHNPTVCMCRHAYCNAHAPATATDSHAARSWLGKWGVTVTAYGKSGCMWTGNKACNCMQIAITHVNGRYFSRPSTPVNTTPSVPPFPFTRCDHSHKVFGSMESWYGVKGHGMLLARHFYTEGRKWTREPGSRSNKPGSRVKPVLCDYGHDKAVYRYQGRPSITCKSY